MVKETYDKTMAKVLQMEVDASMVFEIQRLTDDLEELKQAARKVENYLWKSNEVLANDLADLLDRLDK